MQKLLVVDDESLARSNILYRVSCSGFQFEWIMEAASAAEALEMMADNKPDLLITDIVMNQKNGIDLIREASALYPDLLSIILSGHNDFEYAQSAIQLGTYRYLLKPVRQEDINEALAMASAEILRRKKISRLAVRNDLLERNLENHKLQMEIEAFLHGIDHRDTSQISALLPPAAKYYQVLLLQIGVGAAQDHSKKEYDLMRYGVCNIIEELGKGMLLPFRAPIEYRQITVLAASAHKDFHEAESQLGRLVFQLHKATVSSLQISLHIGTSSVQQSLLAACMHQAKQALDQRLCFPAQGHGHIFYYQDYLDQPADPQLEADMKLYQSSLESGSLSDALKVVKKIMSIPAGKSFLLLRTTYVELICILSRSCFKKGVSIFSFLGSECIGGAMVDRFESIEDLVENLSGIITMALNQWVVADGGISGVLNQIYSYVQSNFTDSELGTAALSEKFCISLGYLSASFTKHFGTTISKYILSLRMEYAKNLLLTTSIPLHAVAESSGFNNLSYFMRVFKSYFHSTPTQYREHRPQKFSPGVLS